MGDIIMYAGLLPYILNIVYKRKKNDTDKEIQQ